MATVTTDPRNKETVVYSNDNTLAWVLLVLALVALFAYGVYHYRGTAMPGTSTYTTTSTTINPTTPTRSISANTGISPSDNPTDTSYDRSSNGMTNSTTNGITTGTTAP